MIGSYGYHSDMNSPSRNVIPILPLFQHFTPRKPQPQKLLS